MPAQLKAFVTVVDDIAESCLETVEIDAILLEDLREDRPEPFDLLAEQIHGLLAHTLDRWV